MSDARYCPKCKRITVHEGSRLACGVCGRLEDPELLAWEKDAKEFAEPEVSK